MVAFVRSTTIAISATSTKITTNFTTAVASGNAVFGFVGYGHASPTTFVSVGNEKSGASSGTVVNGIGNGTNNQSFSGFYFPNVTNSASSFTCSFNSALGFRGLILNEYSGISTVTPLDVSAFSSNASPGTAASAIRSGATTTIFNGDLIFGGVTEIGGTAGLGPVSSGAGYTIRGKSTSIAAVASEDVVQPSAGATTVTWTDSVNGASGTYLVGLMSFKATTAAAGGAQSRIRYPANMDGSSGGVFYGNILHYDMTKLCH